MKVGLRRAGVAAVVITFVGAATFDATAATAAAMQDDKPPASPAPPAPPAREDPANELEELGQTLKAAVMSGALSEEDAIKIYYRMASSLAPKDAKKTADADENAKEEYAAKLDIMRASAPQPGRITALLQPEFLHRDLQLLRVDLDLDRQQMGIITLLLRDYLEAFELASTPVREGLSRYRRSSSDQWIAAALERAHTLRTDIAVANTKLALQRLADNADKAVVDGDTSRKRVSENDQKRAAREAWAQRMVDVTATMEDRLAALRERVQARLAEMEHEGSMVTIDDLVQMARQLRDERARLRGEFTESLGLIALIEPTETERARFDTAVARIRIEHDLNHGRLGGESMNLWAALIETSRGNRTQKGRIHEFPEVKAMLDERAPALAALLDERTQATLDRELRGLEFQATSDHIGAALAARQSAEGVDSARLSSALRPFAAACRREVAASSAVRDELIALLDESSALIDETYPDAGLARRYRDAALRRGFPTEMRQRWSERALESALELDDLDDDSHAALVAIDSDVATTIQMLRTEAIPERIRRDPQRAIERIDAQSAAGNSRAEKFDLEELLGFNHRAYTTLDERTEDQLMAILTPEQFASLPVRPTAFAAGKKKEDKGKGKAGGK